MSQTTKRRFHLGSEEAFPSNAALSTVEKTLTTSSGKRAGNLLREKYFAALSPHTFLPRTYHVLLGPSTHSYQVTEIHEL